MFNEDASESSKYNQICSNTEAVATTLLALERGLVCLLYILLYLFSDAQ